MATSLLLLDASFRPLAEALIDGIRKAGIRHVVTDTLRLLVDQQAAFRRGVSKCDGIKIKSKHQLGLAIDICAADENGNPSWDYRRYAETYKAIGIIAHDLGLVCGQDWYPSPYKSIGLGWDPPHYEISV